jgi:hypothetical protein
VKPLVRILLNALTAMSLVLFATTVVLWVRSYWRLDEFGYVLAPGADAGGVEVGIESGSAGVAITVWLDSPGDADRAEQRGWYARSDDARPVPYAGGWLATRWGFAIDRSRNPSFDGGRLVLPKWVPVTLFALLPIARVAITVRRRRRGIRQGRCPRCGYDLRATPDRCPECGQVPADPSPKRSNH